MLLALCARHKPWILSALSYAHGAPSHHLPRLAGVGKPISFVNLAEDRRRRHHTSECRLGSVSGGAASIWHAILPTGGNFRKERRRPEMLPEQRGEGSWNVAWDVRPARWLHGSDSAWLLFGVCACLAPLDWRGCNLEAASTVEEGLGGGGVLGTEEIRSNGDDMCTRDYRVTGVPPDGRCLFRAVAHGACLRNGEEAPDETRQRELADELRAQVVGELLKRRKEAEWFIEGDFDMYVKNIQKPYAWGGEPELLMASHVLKTPISVFMMDRSSDDLMHISSYGQEYGEVEKSPIKVLFHGYGHYDVLETLTGQSYQ